LILLEFLSGMLSYEYCELVYGSIWPSDQHGLIYQAVNDVTLRTLQALRTLQTLKLSILLH